MNDSFFENEYMHSTEVPHEPHTEEDHLALFNLAELNESALDARNQIRVSIALHARCL